MQQGLGLGQVRWMAASLGLGLAITACSDGSDASFGTASGTGGSGVLAGGGQNPGTNAATGGDGQTTEPNAATGGSSGATTVAKTNWVTAVFDCEFAWGAPYWEVPLNAEGKPDISYLDFVSQWIGQEKNAGLSAWSVDATNPGTGDSCWVCDMVQATASTNVIPVFYTYVIGGQAKELGGFGDCNVDNDGHNLCTDGAQWIRDNRAQVLNAYAQYAKMLRAKVANKPMIYWLEGDYHQYADATSGQLNSLSYPEAGQLIREIVAAIKTNQPTALVGVNHSPWISDAQSQQFWSNMPVDVLDLVWVQGAGDTDKFPNSWVDGTSNYAWLHEKTGLPIMAETSYGAPDRWIVPTSGTTITAADINARIANGVVAALINFPKSSWSSAAEFATKTSAYSSLNATCN